MLTLFSFILTLGCVVFIHELGHFLMARACGVEVKQFSLGFGRVIASYQKSPAHTQFTLGLIPLGGFVRMLESNVASAENRHRAFDCAALYKRFLIVGAGPLANFLLAIILFMGLLHTQGERILLPIIGSVFPSSPAAYAQLKPLDKLIRLDGQPIETWQDFQVKLAENFKPNQPLKLDIQRQNTLKTIVLPALPIEENLVSALGISPAPLLPIIGQVMPKSMGAQAGLKAGDKLIALEGKPIATWFDFAQKIQQSPGVPLLLTVERSGKQQALKITPAGLRSSDGFLIGQLGVAAVVDRTLMEKQFIHRPYDLQNAAWGAVERTFSTSVLSLKMMAKMLLGEASLKQIGGPVAIAEQAGRSAALGWVVYLEFLCLISISVGVLNLLPIPVLDGGHLLYYTVEWVTRQPVSPRIMAWGQQLGIGFILLLTLVAFFNDLNRLFANAF